MRKYVKTGQYKKKPTNSYERYIEEKGTEEQKKHYRKWKEGQKGIGKEAGI